MSYAVNQPRQPVVKLLRRNSAAPEFTSLTTGRHRIMKIVPGSAALRTAIAPKTEAPQGQRPAAPSPQAQAQRATPPAETPRQDKVATAYRIERPIPPPRPNAPRGSCVNLLV